MKKITKTKFKKLEQLCKDAILENDIVFTDEIFTFVELSKEEFFEYKLDESQEVKRAIEFNRTKIKRDLRGKWLDSTNATLNVTLYKLLAGSDERKALSSSSSSKAEPQEQSYTQDEYLKSLKEMGEESAD